MKEHMTTHIDRTRSTMFRDSTTKVKQALEALMESVEEEMLAKADEVFLSIKRDYSSALIGSQSATGKALPREQRVVRKEVLEIVNGSEKSFKRVVSLEPEADEQDGVGREPKVELTDDAVVTEPAAFNEKEYVGCPRVELKGGDDSNADFNGSPIAPEPKPEGDEVSQQDFPQLKPEDNDEQSILDQQLRESTEAADLPRISSGVPSVDDDCIEDSTDDGLLWSDDSEISDGSD